MERLTKREAAILKFSAPAILTSHEVIIARYDAVLDPSESAHFYNHLNNYTKMVQFCALWVLASSL